MIRANAILMFVIFSAFGVVAQENPSARATPVADMVTVLERSCVGTLRALNVAQGTYWGGDENKGFARTLKQLGPDGEGLLNAATVSGEKDGYRFRLVPDKTVGNAQPTKHYQIIAQPVKRLSKRQRSYFTDETGLIRFTEEKREPTRADPEIGPPKER